MRVHKETWIKVGDGTTADIIQALSQSEIPKKAKATEIKLDPNYSWELTKFMVVVDNDRPFLDRPFLPPKLEQVIKFEWDDEE